MLASYNDKEIDCTRLHCFSAVSMLALVSVEGYHGYFLFAWMYGIFLGGFELTLKVYTFDRLRVRQFTRGWGFVQGVKALPYLLGIPISAYISQSSSSAKSGIFFSLGFVVFGSTILFLMECFNSGQHSVRHHDLCKMDTNQSDVGVDNNNDHHQNRRASDLGSFSDMGVGIANSAAVNNVGSNSVNGLLAELAHLQCTCDHINDKLFSLAAKDHLDSNGTGEAVARQVDGVAVLAEEDVVLDEEEMDKIVDEDDDDDDFVRKVFADDDDDDEDVEFIKMEQQVKLFLNLIGPVIQTYSSKKITHSKMSKLFFKEPIIQLMCAYQADSSQNIPRRHAFKFGIGPNLTLLATKPERFLL